VYTLFYQIRRDSSGGSSRNFIFGSEVDKQIRMSTATQQQVSSGPSAITVWYHLVEGTTGLSCLNTTVLSAPIPSNSDVDDFLWIVKSKFNVPDSNILRGISSCQLRLYRDEATFRSRKFDGSRNGSLKPDHLIDGLGRTREEPVIITVP